MARAVSLSNRAITTVQVGDAPQTILNVPNPHPITR